MFDLHNDEPTLQDKLKRDDLLIRVGDDIATCPPPCVFGIHGAWGSGKTSFLHQLHWYLTGDCPEQTDAERDAAKGQGINPKTGLADRVTVVWFEAWRYQHEQDPIIALLQEIRTQLPMYSKFLNKGAKLAEVAIRGALLSMEDLTKRIGFKASKVQEAGERWERENLAVALPSHTIRQQLNAALDQLLGRNVSKKRQDARLVVLIDDLDRCEPDAAFKLLEGIKIYLNLPSCVFVLGMDQRIIERAIAKHTAKDDPPETRHEYAREYLDKLCANIWHLPLINNVGEVLAGWLPSLGIVSHIAPLVQHHQCVAPNPRKIKALANVLARFLADFEGRRDDQLPGLQRHAMLLLLMACLYHEHHQLYRMIERDPEFYDLVLRWATGLIEHNPKEHKPHELLAVLKLPTAFAEPEPMSPETAGPEPTPREEPTFPDPVRGNVFRLQSLVRELGAVEVKVLRRYLLFGQ